MTSENMEAMPQKEMPTAPAAPPPEAEDAPAGAESTLAPASGGGQEQCGGRLPPNAREGKANQLLRDGARWPPVVALLNLTGLGLGYLHMRRWLRWMIHFILTAGLIATAFLTNGARRPGLWATVLGAWVAWMAFDGWRLARAAPAETTGRRWLPVGVAVLLLVSEAAGLWGYRALGQRAFAEGMAGCLPRRSTRRPSRSPSQSSPPGRQGHRHRRPDRRARRPLRPLRRRHARQYPQR